MATADQLFICHRIMDLCAKLSAQEVGIFTCAYAGISDCLSVHGFERQDHQGESFTYLEGWASVDEGNTVYLGDWYANNYGVDGECIDRLCQLEARLKDLLIIDEDGIPV